MSGILDLFVPRERKFFDMLEELSGRAHSGAVLFIQLIEDYGSLSRLKTKDLIERLHMVEHDCDLLTHRIAVELNKTFLTPIDREDIHRLSTLLDDVMDIVYDIGHKLVLYNVNKLPKHVRELAAAGLASVEEVDKLVSKLALKEKIGAHIQRIHELEKESDSLVNEALARLFQDSFSALEVIKLKNIYESLESISNKCEDVADVVEGIVIKYA